jgi:hypothetical protein
MRIGWTIVIWLVLGGVGAAEEAKCPKGDAPIQLEDIEAAPGCIEAHKLHDACAWGSSGDANMTEIVIGKCEAGFLDRMTAAQKRRYESRGQACGERYPITPLGGSIQIYLSSMCQEDLAVTYFKAAKGGRIVGTPRWKVPDIAE